jgi:hypothetical protein
MQAFSNTGTLSVPTMYIFVRQREETARISHFHPLLTILFCTEEAKVIKVVLTE